MEIRIYDTFEDETLRKRWKEIVDMNGYFVQNSYEWCSTWWKYFGNRNRKLYIITVSQNGHIVGIAPMFIQSRVGFRQLRFVGTGLTDLHQFLVEAEFYENSIKTILVYLRKFRRWDLVYLDQVNDEDNLYKYLDESHNSRKKHRIGCAVIDIYGLNWNEYINNIRSAKLRQEYRRRLRKLEDKADLIFARVTTEEKLREYLEDLFRLHFERWLSENENSKFIQDDLRAFIKEVFPLLTREDKVLLYVMKNGEKLISYQLGFFENKTFYCWNSSFSTDYYAYSPGQIITGHIVNDLIETDCRAYNRLRGDYEYKKRWMHRERQHISNNYLFVFSKSNLKGEVLERYYLYWRDEFKDRFQTIISNRHFRSILRLDRQ